MQDNRSLHKQDKVDKDSWDEQHTVVVKEVQQWDTNDTSHTVHQEGEQREEG